VPGEEEDRHLVADLGVIEGASVVARLEQQPDQVPPLDQVFPPTGARSPPRDLGGLLAHDGGVAGHPLGREQWLQEALLALPLGVLAGQQPVAERAADLVVEGIVLAVIRRGPGEHVVDRVGVGQQVQLQAQSPWAGEEPHRLAVGVERPLTGRHQAVVGQLVRADEGDRPVLLDRPERHEQRHLWCGRRRCRRGWPVAPRPPRPWR
jgi:hypothetical protein